ncbi:MAG TPA: threonine synthase [Magnetospirillaceae bacterium]
MPYHSTRGRAQPLKFDDVLLAGLAPDGGLYVPSVWPRISDRELRQMATLPYAELAVHVVRPFLDGTIDDNTLATMTRDAYKNFDHPDVAPLTPLGKNEFLLELFHGPTLSFKDYALQLVGRLLDHVLTQRNRRATIVVATSGDTGSAAIEACRDRNALDIFVLHPKGRVSEVQRRQMTTVDADNVHNIAIEGTFDDCQNLVKGLFADLSLRKDVGLAAMNSINWARIVAQIVYYVKSAAMVDAPGAKMDVRNQVSYAVPTGNFGNVFAAYAAKKIGLPVQQMIVASNANDILTRFFETGEMKSLTVQSTLSPSMDIQVSSNFERYLFDLVDSKPDVVNGTMEQFRQSHGFRVSSERMAKVRATFDAYRLDDAGTIAAMKKIHDETGVLIDPHSAIGVAAARAKRKDPNVPMVCVATAHPAKFPDAVEKATGIRPALPPHLADIMQRPERCEEMRWNLDALKDYIRSVAKVAV